MHSCFSHLQSDEGDLAKLRSELEEGLDQLTLSRSTDVQQVSLTGIDFKLIHGHLILHNKQ